MYTHIIGLDDELWYVLKDGIIIEVDGFGMVNDRKTLTPNQNKTYRKHHRARGVIVDSLPHYEYKNIIEKSTSKTTFGSLCVTSNGNQQVKEAMANLLVQQYELFRMKEDEDIETMFSRFQTLISGLQILIKGYTTSDHVKKILRSIPIKYIPKVTVIQEGKHFNTLSLESIVSNLQIHEMELNGDEPDKKFKSLALKSIGKYIKTSQAYEPKEATRDEDSEKDLDDDEMDFIINRFQYLANKNKRSSCKSSGFRGSSSRVNKYNQKRILQLKKSMSLYI